MAPNLTYVYQLADLEEMAATAHGMVGRCDATGLEPEAYRGLIGAARTLGAATYYSNPFPQHWWRPAGQGPWTDDREMVYALADLETDLATRTAQVRSYIRDVHRQLDDDPTARNDIGMPSEYEGPLEILQSLLTRLKHALSRIQSVPESLGDTYAAAYALVRRGRVLPYDGRWITGIGANTADTVGLGDNPAATATERHPPTTTLADSANADAALEIRAGVAPWTDPETGRTAHVVTCECMPRWWRSWSNAESAQRDASDHEFSRHGAHDPRFCNFYGRHDGPCPNAIE